MYIPRFGWVGSGTVYALVVNRLHTRMDLYFADAASGRSRLVLTESEPNGYLDDERFHITWLKSGDRFLWPSWRDGHMHLYLYSFDKNNPLAADARLERQLTKGEFEVSSVAAVNESSGTVYFEANAGDRARNRSSPSNSTAARCSRSPPKPGVHSANFASDGQYFVDRHSALLTPPHLSFCKVGGACSTILGVARGFRLQPDCAARPRAQGCRRADHLVRIPAAAPGRRSKRAPPASR